MVDPKAVHALVRDYLWARGFARTLERFEEAVVAGGRGAGGGEGEGEDERGASSSSSSSSSLPSVVRKRRRAGGGQPGLEEREAMRRLVLAEGAEEQVLARLGKGEGALALELRCLVFASRLRKRDVAGALAYAQRELAPYVVRGAGGVGKEKGGPDAMDVDAGGEGQGEGWAWLAAAERVREVMGLLAYPGGFERRGCRSV